MGCCNKERTRQEREYPEGIDPCCKISGPRCLCLPYDDPWVISAQILSIVATAVSWVWWVTFIISGIGLALFQLFWCLRMPSAGMYAHSAVATFSALASLGVGIYCLIKWKYMNSCNPFEFYSYQYDDDWRWSSIVYQIESVDDYINSHSYDDYFDDDVIVNWKLEGTEDESSLLDYIKEARARAKDTNELPDPDYCQQEVWGSIALVCFFLWMAAAVCMFYFVKSGRHATWEAKLSVTSEDDAAPAKLEAVPSRDGGEELVQADAAVLSSDKEDEIEEASEANV